MRITEVLTQEGDAFPYASTSDRALLRRAVVMRPTVGVEKSDFPPLTLEIFKKKGPVWILARRCLEEENSLHLRNASSAPPFSLLSRAARCAMPMNRDPDLHARFQRGERDALEEVYRTHVDAVGLVLKRGFVLDAQGGKRVPGVGSQEELKDLVQEVFVRAFSPKARESYDATRAFKPYIQRIAKNLLVDHGRRLGRLKRFRVILKDEDPIGEEPEGSLDDRRRLTLTAAFVAALDEPLRTLYALRYVEGRSQNAVAEQMDRTRKQVRLLEDQLRAALRSQLQHQGLAPEANAA